jgi:hypothetical protein
MKASSAGGAIETASRAPAVGVDLRTRITQAFEAGRFDPDELERCFTDLLTSIYPGLSPVPGGTDFGRDADINDELAPPARLLVTGGDRRANVKAGLSSMAKNGIPVERVIVATSQEVSETKRASIRQLLFDEVRASLAAVCGRHRLRDVLQLPPAPRLAGLADAGRAIRWDALHRPRLRAGTLTRARRRPLG